MADKIDSPIPNLTTPWEGYKGKRVRELLQSTMQQLSAKKFGAHHASTDDTGMMTLRFFADEDSKEMWEGDPENNADKVLSSVSFYSKPVETDYTLTARITQNLASPMVKGASNTIKFTYSSYYGGDPTDLDTENGYAKFTINGTEIEALAMTLTPGGSEYTADLGAYLTQETNTVKLEIGNRHGKSRTWNFTVQAVEIVLSVDSSHDESILRDSNWTLRVACRGASALVHIKIDGTETGRSTIANSTYDFPIDTNDALNAGAHTIEIYAENSEYGITSETIRTSFIKRGLSIPSVCIGGAAPAEVTLYDTASIPYFFYFPTASEGDVVTVNLEVRDSSGNVLYAPTPQKVTALADGTSGMQEWRFAADDNNYLALGSVVLAVKVGSASATHTIGIVDAGVTLAAATECKVHLSPVGKTNADSDAENWCSYYNDVLTCEVVRSENFQLTGENGFGSDRYLIKSGKSITLASFLPFGADFGANAAIAANRTGRTIEFEFKTKNCTNTSAKVISCMNGDVGIEIYANRAVLSCASGKIETMFPDEERIRVGYCIDGTTTHCVNQLVSGTTESDCNIAYMYVNGVIVRMMDYGESSWKQPSPQYITIGSDECELELYGVRIYDKSLNYQQMIGNYAFDTPNVEDKIAIARRNDVLNTSNQVDFAKVLVALPNTPYKIWEMDRMPTGKKDKVKTNTEFVNPRWSEGSRAMASFTCLQHDQVLDGTSSLSYPDPYKNFGATYNGQWTLHLGDVDIEIVSYSITEGIEDGEVDFVDKVNFASSEGIGNILAMNMYQKILLGAAAHFPQLLTPQQAAQQAAGKEITYRHSLSGFPEIGYLRTYTDGTPSIRFLSLFNFINNKYSPSIFGLDNSGDAVLWEVNDNVNFFMEELPEGEYIDGKWVCRATELYYSRVPKKSPASGSDYGTSDSAGGVSQANKENKALRDFHNWVQSCNPHVADRYKTLNGSYRTLSTPVTYGDVTYTQDTPAYRYAKFSNEYAAKGLNIHSAVFYLLFCDDILGVDSFDKNKTIGYIGGKWYIFIRDTDTQNGYGNRGTLLYKSYHEWGDSYDETTGETGQIIGEQYNAETQSFEPLTTVGTPIYNGRLSGLWDCIVQTQKPLLQEMYLAMRSAGLTADGFMEMYDSFWTQWCEALYNVDGMGYANTGRFDMAHGDKRESFRQFFKHRQRYMDSKYSANTSQTLELRLWGSGAGVVLRHCTPIYAALNWGSGGIQTVRNINANSPSYFPSTGATFNETTFTVYDPDLLTGIGTYTENVDGSVVENGLQDISSSLDITGLAYCRRLESLILDYSGKNPNTNLSVRVADVCNSIALKKLVIRNCPNVTAAFPIQSEKIEEVDLRATAASGLTIQQTASLTSVQLGAAIKTLKLNGNANLETLTLEGWSQLNHLEVNDCPKADTRSLLETILSSSDCVLSEVVMHGVEWAGFSVEHLEKLTNMEADITGVITVTGNVTFKLKQKLLAVYGDIDSDSNPLKVNYANRVLTGLSVAGTMYMGAVGDYQMVAVPETSVANNFSRIDWELSATPHATIDAATGIIHVTSVVDEAQGDSATVTVTATLVDGTTVTASASVGFYERSCHVGDLVYADGSFSDRLDNTKTVVGVCFYVNPADKTQRLCCAKSNIGSYPWGLYYDSGNGTNGFASINMEDRPSYSCFDVPTITNRTSAGASYINEANYRDETSTGDADGYKFQDPATAVGQLGFETLTAAVGGYEAGQTIPIGLANTLRIIAHRNIILGDSGVDLPIPAASSSETLMACLTRLMSEAQAAGGAAKYRQFYYPAASMCNAYEPGVKSDETLADCFRQGKWFLPASGDISRIYWLHSRGYAVKDDGTVPPFANAYSNGQLTAFGTADYWSSTEGSSTNAWYVNFSYGNLNGIGKFGSFGVRAVAAF